MITLLKRPLALVALAGIVAVAMFALAACGDDDDSSDDVSVVAALSLLDSAGFHDIDDAINEEKKIPATARTTTLRMQTLTRLTAWPTSELQAQATALDALFGELAAALDGESPDVAVAGEAARKAHVAQHDFSGAVWTHLYEAAGVGAGDGQSH